MNNEELLPKWSPSMERKSNVAESLFAGLLLILLALFTLGIVSGLQHTNDATKGRE
jgi:hypothetical protein